MAIIAVVILHESAQRFYVSFPSQEWEVRMVYDSLVRWGVPVFIMISGALFLDKEKTFSITKLYTKNILRIVSAYLFWSIIYNFYTFSRDDTFIDLFLGVVKGPLHLWFLKMLLGLYIVVPILRSITSNKRIETYFLFLAFITSFIIPLLIEFFQLYDKDKSTILKSLVNSFYLNLAVGYSGYFILGHFLNTYTLSATLKRVIYVFGFLSFIIVLLCTHTLSHKIGAPQTILYSNLKPFTLFESMAIFIIVKDRIKIVPIQFKRHLILLSKLTFSIYLIHMMVIMILKKILTQELFDNNILLYIPCFTIVVLFISTALSFMLSKIPIIRKYIV